MAEPARASAAVQDPAYPRREPGLMPPGWVLDEAVLEAERRRAWTEGYAARQAERRRLSVIDGGRGP